MMINRLLMGLLATIFLMPLMGKGTAVIAGENSQTAYNPTYNCYTCLRLVPSSKKNQQANPIYILEVYHQGRSIYTFETVTGRAFTQTRNRNRAGTDSPLPDGKYSVSSSSVWGTLAEVGGRFIPIKPQFRTGRSALGIHYDPSYNRANGEDGTSGCIGLTNRQDFETLRQFIETYKPQLLMVDIQ